MRLGLTVRGLPPAQLELGLKHVGPTRRDTGGKEIRKQILCDGWEGKGQVKLGIIRRMRFPVWLLLLPSTAFGVAVGPLPAPEYADTEVSTNIPFAVSLETMSRIEFALTFGYDCFKSGFALEIR